MERNDLTHPESLPEPPASEPAVRHLMLLPSLNCQANCRYCFGPNRGDVMPQALFDAALAWMRDTQTQDTGLHLTFHGGEPLLAGKEWYSHALPLLKEHFPHTSLHIQSNLWLLDDDFAALLSQYGVKIGTSLDGPQDINDVQRGAGSFAHTWRGIQAARRRGMNPGVICTFTRRSAQQAERIFDFFVREKLSFSVHQVIGQVGGCTSALLHDLQLSIVECSELFVHLFDLYMQHIPHIRISTFDQIARSLSAGAGGLCTFCDCLGKYLTIAPDGGIFTCNRFAPHSDWRLGWLQDKPSLDELAQSPAWKRLQARQTAADEECRDCVWRHICHGGCAYNSMAAGKTGKDPYCQIYRRLFTYISDQALAQVFSKENIAAVVSDPAEDSLLRHGFLLQIMKGG